MELGRYQLDTTALWTDRATTARDRPGDAAFIDMPFTDLVADPKAMIRSLCTACDVEWDAAAALAADARLAEPNQQHGAHRYAPEDFGLDRDKIRARLSTYARRFGVD